MVSCSIFISCSSFAAVLLANASANMEFVSCRLSVGCVSPIDCDFRIEHERPLLGRCCRQTIIRKLDMGVAAHTRDALVEIVKRAALELTGELAAARCVLGLADGAHSTTPTYTA